MQKDLDQIDDGTVFIIGAGHFGARAARIICQKSDAPIFVVDTDEKNLDTLSDLPVKVILGDGIQFLVGNDQALKSNNTIVPALPEHLAYVWLKGILKRDRRLTKISTPEEVRTKVRHLWPASDGSTLVSYADFLCPDDCPEPSACTVTGEKREQPLYALLGDLHIPPFHVHIIRSRQLAPGLGGYKVGDLRDAAKEILGCGNTLWILGTACKCHGILTAFEVH